MLLSGMVRRVKRKLVFLLFLSFCCTQSLLAANESSCAPVGWLLCVLGRGKWQPAVKEGPFSPEILKSPYRGPWTSKQGNSSRRQCDVLATEGSSHGTIDVKALVWKLHGAAQLPAGPAQLQRGIYTLGRVREVLKEKKQTWENPWENC